MAVLLSTGPMEQLGSSVNNVRAKVLNNSTVTVNVEVRVFDLNGEKVLLESDNFTLQPRSSIFTPDYDVSNTNEYEVQFRLASTFLTNTQLLRLVLPSSWGLDEADGNIVPSHRVVTQELKLVRRTTSTLVSSKRKKRLTKKS